MIQEILDILLDRRLIAIVTLLVGCFILRDVVRTLVFIVDAGRWRRRPKNGGKSELPGRERGQAARVVEPGGKAQPPASRSASSSGSYPSSERALEMSQ